MSSTGQGRYSILIEVRGAIEAERAFKNLTDSVTQIDTKFKQSAVSMGQLGQNIQRMGQQVQTSNAPLQQLGQGMTTVQQRSQQLVSSQGALGNSFRQMGTSVQGSLGGLTQYNTLLGNTGQQTLTMRQRLGELGSSFAGLAGSMTGVIGSGVILFNTLNSLRDAQFQLERSNLQVEFRMQRNAVRQAHVNRLMEQGKEGTQQYELAVSQLALTQNRGRLALEANEKAQERYNLAIANFAGQVLPAASITVGSLTSAITHLTAKNAEGVTAVTRLGTAFRGLGASMSFISLSNPFFIALTAIGATLAVFVTNVGGARDAINGFGQALGDAVPFLRPVLDFLGSAGQGLLELTGQAQQTGLVIRDEFGQIQSSAEGSMGAASNEVDEFGNTVATTLPSNVNQGVDAVIAAFDRMTLSITSSFRAPVQDTINFFRDNFGGIIEAVTESKDVIGELAIESGQSLVYMNAAVEGASKNFGELGNTFQVVQRDATTFEITTGTMRAVMAATGMEAHEVGNVFKELEFTLVEVEEVQTGVVAGNKLIEVSFSTISEVAAKVEERIAAMTEKYGQLSPEVENAARVLLTQQLTIEATGQATNTFTEAQQKAYDMMRTGIDTTADLATRYDQFKASMDSTVPSLDELTAGFNRETGAILQMTNALAPAIQQIQTSTQGMVDQKSVLDGLAPSFKASADSIILMKDGVAEIISPTQIVNSILAGQANELNNVSGLMDMYTQRVQSAGVSLIDFIALLEQSGAIDKDTAKALEERGKALGLITEEETKAAEATKEHQTVTQQLADSNRELATSLQEVRQGFADTSLAQELVNKGTLEAQKVFSDLGQSVLSNAAFLEEYKLQLQDTTNQQNLWTEGVHNVEKAHQESIASIATVSGELQRYNQLLADGEIQSVAYAEAQHEMIRTYQEMEREMASVEGAIASYDQLLKAGDITQKNFNLGLRQGQLDARSWFAELKQADGVFVGMDRGLRDLSESLHVDLPQGMQLSTEQIQNFIGVMSGSTTAVNEFKSSLEETVKDITDSLIVGLDDLDDDVEDAVDEIADNWEETLGTKMPKSTQRALEQIGKDKSWAEAAQFGMDNMLAVFDDPEAFQDAFESVTKGLKKEMDEMSPEVAAAAQQVIDAFKAVAEDPSNILLWKNLETAIDNLQNKSDSLNLQGPFELAKEKAVEYSETLDELIGKLTTISAKKLGPGVDPRLPEILGQSQALDEVTEPGGKFAEEPTAAPLVDTSAATKALQDLQVLAAATVQRIILEFNKVAPAMTTAFNTGTQNAAGTLNMLVEHTTAVMDQVSLAASLVAENWTTHFNTATQNAAGVMNMLVEHTNATMALVSAAAASVAEQWTTHFNTATQNAASVMNNLLDHAITVMNQVADTAIHVESIWTSTFARITSAVVAEMDRINSALDGVISHANTVAQAIEAIGSAAASARSEVESLANAINSLEDRTITITTRYETIGSPPPTGAGGIGYHDGMAYLPMAGGSGISGLGFAPIVIDHPTNLLVGESGPELVSVTPINRNRNGRTGEISPFADLRMAGGSSNAQMEGGQGFGGTINLTNGNVIFEANQGPITVNQGATGGTGIPSGGFNNTNVGLGTGQGAIFNVPGGQGAISGNATVCINGQCFGNAQGLGAPIVDQQQHQQLPETHAFQPVFDDQGMIKAMETLVEWFKFLGLPTGASVPGTAMPPIATGGGTITGTGVGAFAGNISMQGGQIVFDANQGDMELQTSTGAISIAGNGQAFARAGNAIASAGGVGLFGSDQTTEQLTQLNRTLEGVSGSLQAMGNSMASLGNEVVFGNQQLQQTLQGTGPGGVQNITGGTPVVFQGAGNQVGFQSFPGGGAVGAGGAAGDPLGFLSSTFGQLGLQLPAGIPSSGGQVAPNVGGIGTGGGISTGGTGCNVCGAATGLGNAATDLSGAAGQLGNAINQFPSGLGGTTGIPTTNGGFPSGGGMGTGGLNGTQPGTGSGCSCSCMPMDSDPNRYKIEDGSGNDCNNHIYFDTIEQCHSRLNEICPGENTSNPPAIPTTPPQNPTGNQGMFPPGVMVSVSGNNAVACANGICTGGQQQIPGIGQQGMPIGNPPAPPQIVQQAGLPSQAPDVNQDPSSWTIVESAGLAGTYDIIDDSGDVVQLGFRTLRDAETYLNYFVSYYEWVQSGSTGIPGPIPVGGGTIGGGTGISAGSGGVQAIAGGGGAFAQAGNAIAQAGNFLGNALGFGNSKSTGEKKIGSVPLLESIPRAQGPFRSGQDNMEPIYDNSAAKLGADRMGPNAISSETTSQDEEEYGRKPRFISRVQRHLDTALALAGDYAELKEAIVNAIQSAFGDIMLNLTVNSMLDGNAIHSNQKKFSVKQVSLMT